MARLLSPIGLSIRYSKVLLIFFAFYRSLAQPLYFAGCDIDPEQAAGEGVHRRGARPRTDSHNRRPAHPSHSAALCNDTRICVRKVSNSATPDATSGQGAKRLNAAGLGAYAFTCACGLRGRETRRDVASF
jgi:hypothetical protein